MGEARPRSEVGCPAAASAPGTTCAPHLLIQFQHFLEVVGGGVEEEGLARLGE